MKALEDHLLGLFLCICTKEFVYAHTRNLIRGMIKTLLFLRKNEIYVFAVYVGEERKIKRELFELSGLPEKPG